MKKRKWISLLLISVLAAMVLQGCKSETAKEPDTPETQETESGAGQEPDAGASEEETADDGETQELSDTIRWFNASYAVLTELNRWDYNLFGGMEASAQNQALVRQLLEEWWDVTDRESADETLLWILTEGHRVNFAEDMQYLEQEGMGEVPAEGRADWLMEHFENLDFTPDEAQHYADNYALYEEHGADAIAGWDYCRALNLMSYYYVAGYYDLNEALDKSLEIAQTVQPLYESWDELIDSYMYGYEYWQEASSEERRAVYEELKSRDDNPYAVDFKVTLEKSW